VNHLKDMETFLGKLKF